MEGLTHNKSPLILMLDALGVVFIWFWGVTAYNLLIPAISQFVPALRDSSNSVIISAIFSDLLWLVLICKASQKFSNRGFLVNMGLLRESRLPGQFFLIPILAGLLLAYFSFFLKMERHISLSQPFSGEISYIFSGYSSLTLSLLILLLLTAPLAEEIIFRGYFFYVASKIRGEIFAVLFVFVLFALFHLSQYWGDWVSVGILMFLGFVTTMLRAWTGTIIPSVVMHYVYNWSAVVIFYSNV